jgi:MFS family permease
VVVGEKEIAGLSLSVEPGVYVVGTGSCGVGETFFILGIVHLIIILGAAMLYRIPPKDWKPVGWDPQHAGTSSRLIRQGESIDPDRAIRTSQFYLLWIMLCFNVTAGIGVLGVAKTMLTEIFGSALPAIVTGSFAATYVLMTSTFNMVGRFFWATISDRIGRKNTYALFFSLGCVLYCVIPWIAWQVNAVPSVIWLIAFYVVTMLIFTMYGGGFATIPAYLADLFGTQYVGAIHGRLLTAWSVAGVIGPWAITALRENASRGAISDLAKKVSANDFERVFGAPLSELPALIQKKTVTIPRLLEIAPAGTADPSTNLYNTTMFLMAALLLVAFFANASVRPVRENVKV